MIRYAACYLPVTLMVTFVSGYAIGSGQYGWGTSALIAAVACAFLDLDFLAKAARRGAL